jgi:hypothetical protein
VPVGGQRAAAGGAGRGVLIFAGRPPFGPVGGVGATAVLASARAAGVAADGAVAVLPPGRVRFGKTEIKGLCYRLKVGWCGLGEEEQGGGE